jgi:hypothetical protein
MVAMSVDVRQVTVAGFLRGLRIAILVVTAVPLLGLALPNMLARLDAPPGPVIQVAYFLLPAAVVAADTVLLARDRFWGPWRGPVLGLLLVAYLSFTLWLPADAVFTVDNWYFNIIGWFGVLLLFDRPLRSLLVYLAGYLAVTALPAVVHGAMNRVELSGLAVTAVSVGGFQVLTASAAGALRRVAASAAQASASAERTRTRRAIARRVHQDRRRRYVEIAATARPLLAGLADGTLDPADADVARRCAIEAARLRRLFAESDESDDPLLHEIRACVDVAERRGVPVEVISQGRWPALPREVRRALTDGPMQVLSTVRDAARVAIVGTSDTVSVSVLADRAAPIARPPETDGVATTSLSSGNRLWVEATWRAAT